MVKRHLERKHQVTSMSLAVLKRVAARVTLLTTFNRIQTRIVRSILTCNTLVIWRRDVDMYYGLLLYDAAGLDAPLHRKIDTRRTHTHYLHFCHMLHRLAIDGSRRHRVRRCTRSKLSSCLSQPIALPLKKTQPEKNTRGHAVS